MSVNCDGDAIKNTTIVSHWNLEDKRMLLVALKNHGTSNIGAIQKLLPHKTITEIRFAFEKYSKLAQAKFNEEEKLRKEDSAINQWMKILKKTNVKSNGVTDIIPRVLKYVAMFERRPVDDDVNLRDCYLSLSDMSNGMASKIMSPKTNYFFYENLSRLAQSISKTNIVRHKEFIKNLKSLDNIAKPQVMKTYNRNKKKKDTVVLNPLKIPDVLLKKDEQKGCDLML